MFHYLRLRSIEEGEGEIEESGDSGEGEDDEEDGDGPGNVGHLLILLHYMADKSERGKIITHLWIGPGCEFELEGKWWWENREMLAIAACIRQQIGSAKMAEVAKAFKGEAGHVDKAVKHDEAVDREDGVADQIASRRSGHFAPSLRGSAGWAAS